MKKISQDQISAIRAACAYMIGAEPPKDGERTPGVLEMARYLGVSGQAVTQWCTGKRRVPKKHCPYIEGYTGIACERLRPELEWIER